MSAETEDSLVAVPGGNIFVRRWISGSTDLEPIILLHDSLALQRNLIFGTIQIHLLSPVRKVRPMISLLGPSNKPNHRFNIKDSHWQHCS